MSNKVYIYILAFMILVALPASLWLVAFFSPAYAGKIHPEDKWVVNDPSPRVAYKWLKTPFVKARSARLFINDREVKDLKLTKRGIEFNAANLADGQYKAYALIKYDFPYYKEVRQSWVFEVDTKAPQVDVDYKNASSKDDSVATNGKALNFTGSTEKGSRLYISGIDGRRDEIPVNASGIFSHQLALPQTKNDLTMMAVDRAGNITKRRITAISDISGPAIVQFSPTGEKLVSGYPSELSISAKDNESWVDKAEFQIEGTDKKVEMAVQKDGSFKGALDLTDGKYSGSFRIYDGAGHTAVKTVSFEVSTTKIEVSRAKRQLFLYKQGKLVKTYKVAVGKPGRSTPAGSFRIVNKRYNPTWVNPGSAWAKDMPSRIPPGPDNPLGTRAMDLSVPLIRIHGTPNSASIGHAASNGCVRMYKWQAEELYRQVKIGTPVIIF